MSTPGPGPSSRPPLRDFVGTQGRFRTTSGGFASEPPARDTSASGSFRYTPASVKRTNRPLVGRVWSLASSHAPRAFLYLAGLTIGLWGASHIPGVLSMRGSQFSLVNHVLLVFTGSFLVFLASHERAVERGTKVPRESGTQVGA